MANTLREIQKSMLDKEVKQLEGKVVGINTGDIFPLCQCSVI
jgi:hypothetical protein